MTTQILRVFYLLLLCGMSAIANAQILRYDFSGTVLSASATDPTATNQDIFGTITSPGDPYTGFFEVDLSAPSTVVIPGMVGGSAVGYDMSPSLRFQILLNGVTFENDGTFFVGVVNDFTDDSTIQPIDFLTVFDGVDPVVAGADFVGSTFLADGASQAGALNLGFINSTATAFSSTALPSNLSLSDFDFNTSNGFISGLDDNMNQIGVNFTIDEISVTAVPEPGSVCFVAATALGVLRRRRRV